MVQRRFVRVLLRRKDAKGKLSEHIYLTSELMNMLDFASERLGWSKSELIRVAIINYLDSHNLITQRLHEPITA